MDARRIFRWSLVGALSLIVGGAWFSYRSLGRFHEAACEKARLQEVMTQLKDLETGIDDLLRARRDFVLTGLERDAAEFRRVHEGVRRRLGSLGAMLQDHPEQKIHLGNFTRLLDAYDQDMEELSRQPGARTLEEVRTKVLSGKAWSTFLELDDTIQKMLLVDQGLLETHETALQSGVRLAFLASAAGGGAALLVVILGSWALWKELTARERIERKLQQANQELGVRVADRTAELTRVNHNLVQEVQKHLLTGALLRESEERFRRLVETCPDGILCHRDGVIIFLNSAARRMFGIRQEEAVGRSIHDFLPQDVEETSRTLEASPTDTDTVGIFLESRALRRDGTPLDVETAAVPLREAAGLMYQVFVRDLTERKLAEKRIRDQAALLDKVQDAIIVKTLENRVAFWNRGAERIYGWTAEEALGRPTTELIYGAGLLQEHELARRRALEEGGWRGELVQQTRAGDRLIVESRWSVMRDEEDRPAAFIVANTDITEKKTLEAKFLRAQRLESLGTLAGGIAHDLNNVLTPILMALKLLRKERPEKEKLALLATAQASVERGTGMIRQLLSFAGGGDHPHSQVDLKKIVEETASFLEHTLPKSIRIVVDLPDSLWPVAGDPTQLSQVLMNLAINARDAMPEGGELRLHGENVQLRRKTTPAYLELSPGPHVHLTVTDSGTGIPTELLDKIFDPFFTTKEMGKGTGLGLSTALGIVRSHGGAFNVYSEVGRGSSFSIYLPAQLAAPAAGIEVSGDTLPQGQNRIVLLVDDEPDILAMTRAILQANGYQVLTAGSGEKAIALLREKEGRIDAVVLDMMMPGLDGPATMRLLHSLQPRLPVVAVSGLAAPGRIAEVLAAGAASFLSKPFSDEQLLRSLHQVLSPHASDS